MKIFILVVVAQILTSVLPGFANFSYAQNSQFEFKFGNSQKLENITSNLNEQENIIKWINVNTLDTTWSVQGDELICKGLPIGVVRSEKQYEKFFASC